MEEKKGNLAAEVFAAVIFGASAVSTSLLRSGGASAGVRSAACACKTASRLFARLTAERARRCRCCC
jgi:hypothetical protein